MARADDVSLLEPAIAPISALLAAWRARGWPVLHTREAHRPDLSDCPPAKRLAKPYRQTRQGHVLGHRAA